MIRQVHGVRLLVLRLAELAVGKVWLQRPGVGRKDLHRRPQPGQCGCGLRRGGVPRGSAGDGFGQAVAPAAAPSLFTGTQLSLIYSWLATLGAEYLLASGKGIGNTIIDGREHFWMDLVLFGVVVVGLVGFVLNALLAALEKRLLAWRDRTITRY